MPQNNNFAYHLQERKKLIGLVLISSNNQSLSAGSPRLGVKTAGPSADYDFVTFFRRPRDLATENVVPPLPAPCYECVNNFPFSSAVLLYNISKQGERRGLGYMTEYW